MTIIKLKEPIYLVMVSNDNFFDFCLFRITISKKKLIIFQLNLMIFFGGKIEKQLQNLRKSERLNLMNGETKKLKLKKKSKNFISISNVSN